MPTPRQIAKAQKKDKKRLKRMKQLGKFLDKELTPIDNKQLAKEETELKRLQKVYQSQLKEQSTPTQEAWLESYIKKVYAHAENHETKKRQDAIAKLFMNFSLEDSLKNDPVLKQMSKCSYCDDCKCETNHFPCLPTDPKAKVIL